MKGVMAAAIAAQIPVSIEEAEAAYENLGIIDMGNGWYRCWMSFEDNGEDRTFSVHGKAGSSGHMIMSHGKVRAYFDLTTGDIGKIEVCEDKGACIGTADGDILAWGAQLEEGRVLPESWTSAQRARHVLARGKA